MGPRALTPQCQLHHGSIEFVCFQISSAVRKPKGFISAMKALTSKAKRINSIYMRTKIFKSGNSMALRIPSKFKAKEGEVSIKQVGNQWVVEPLLPAKWPRGFFRKIRIEDPAFIRAEQGEHRDFAE